MVQEAFRVTAERIAIERHAKGHHLRALEESDLEARNGTRVESL